MQDIIIYLDGKLRAPKKLEISKKLNEIREELKEKYKEDFIFLNGQEEIEKEDEKEWTLDIIIYKNNNNQSSINLKSTIKQEENKDSSEPVNRENSVKYSANKITQNQEKTEKEIIQEENKDFSVPLKHRNSVKSLAEKFNQKQEKTEKEITPMKGSKLLFTKKNEDKINDENLGETKKNVSLDIYQYPKIEFTKEEEEKAITILVIGETGSGKTTLINSFVNAVMGITISMKFRYFIISENDQNLSQAHSQTQDVTIYKIRSNKGKCYKVIDTPGYGDVRGINQDKIITEKISKLFNEELHTVNAICFVARSSAPRLTPTNKYILHSILELFGEDVIPNFIAMLTFCDAELPQVLAALKEPGSVYDIIIPHVKEPWYYQFNNSAFFSVNSNAFTNMFWDLGMRSFNRFIQRLDEMEKKSLNQTRKVIDERRKLEELIVILQQKLTDTLDKVSECKQHYQIIDDLKRDIIDSKNYTKMIDVPKVRQIDLKQGQHTTTCLVCNITCHKNCYYADNEDKKLCSAMYKNKCKFCEKKCEWNQHKNTPYILESYIEKEIVTLEKIKEKYLKSKSEMNDKKIILEKIKNKILDLNNSCLQIQQEITDTINRLKKIALNKDVLTSEEHIELLIQSEKMERKEGFIQRIEALEELKKQKELMRNAYQNKIPKLEEIQKFLEDYYKKEKDKKNCLIF